MFKLSLAFAAVSSVVGQVTLQGYCSELGTKCLGTYGINASICEAAFIDVSLGTITDENTNTLGCRLKYLTVAAYNTTDSCRYAGATGGGRCGSVVNNTCDIATSVCAGVIGSSYADTASCRTGLDGIAHQWGYNQGATAGSENSLECRVYHAIGRYAFADTSHCAHFNATGAPCTGTVAANTAHYCNTIQYHCNGTNLTQFGSAAQCMASSAKYPTSATDSAVGSNTQNTLGCRSYHAQASLFSTVHCAHAGPSGGNGVCGSYGEAWSNLASSTPCNDTATTLFITSMGTKANLDAAVPAGAATYSTAITSGNSQTCRIYHLTVAQTDASHCAHGGVTGDAVCGTPLVENLCDMIGGVCAWGTNATYQFATRAACVTALSNVTAGTPGATSGNSQQCRFYHTGVAASYKAGAIQGNATDAAAQLIAHCSHVIGNPSAGCSNAAAPTAAPTPKSTSSADALSLMVPAAIALAAVISL